MDFMPSRIAFNEREFDPSEWEYLGRNSEDTCNVYWNGYMSVYEWDDGSWNLIQDDVYKITWYVPGNSYAEAVDNWIDDNEEGSFSV